MFIAMGGILPDGQKETLVHSGIGGVNCRIITAVCTIIFKPVSPHIVASCPKQQRTEKITRVRLVRVNSSQ